MTKRRDVDYSGKREGIMKGSRNDGVAFAYVTSLFFAWGFATALIDPLVAAVREVFDLSVAEALLTASAWFLAYGIVSLPAAALLARLSYARAIMLALAIMAAGAALVPIGTALDIYEGILLGLFVIASGVTLLQVAVNPLAAQLGPAPLSHFRLNLAQALNSLGTVLAPWLGAQLLLTGGVFDGGPASAASRQESLDGIGTAFLALGGSFVLLAVMFWSVRTRIDRAAPAPRVGSPLSALRCPWALAGAAAIFLYVGAEVTIGGLLTNFLASPDTLGLPLVEAGKLVSLYWAGAMAGRFLGSALLARLPAAPLLALSAAAAGCLCLLVLTQSGPLAGYAALSIGLFNSIMFPTIFTLTLERSRAPAPAVSGLLCTAIVGGAVLPQLAGRIADAAGTIAPAFVVPAVAYGALLAFAIGIRRARPASAAVAS